MRPAWCLGSITGRLISIILGFSKMTPSSPDSSPSSVTASPDEPGRPTGLRGILVLRRMLPKTLLVKSVGGVPPPGGVLGLPSSISSRRVRSRSEGPTVSAQTRPSSANWAFCLSICIWSRSMRRSRSRIPGKGAACSAGAALLLLLTAFEAATSWASRSMRYNSLVSNSLRWASLVRKVCMLSSSTLSPSACRL